MAHSEFSPSQLHRIIECPGSVQLYRELKPVNISSPYAEEGTLLHNYMERLLKKEMQLTEIMDPEHRALCKTAYEYVIAQADGDDFTIYSEVHAKINDLPQVFGTSDVVMVNPKREAIHIMDFKFGGNVPVSCQDNPQFYAYAIGAIDTLHLDTTWTIWVHVIQPRRENFQAHMVSWNKLQEWKETVLRPAILNAESEDPRFHPSEDGCRWCLCKAMCQVCHQAAQEAAAEIFSAYSLAQNKAAITKDELARFYKASAELKAQIKAVEEYVLTELMAGRKIPGYKMVYGRATRKWKDEVLAARYITDHYDADPEDLYETKFKSPAQIEKIFKEVKKDKDFADLITVPQGSPKIVEDDVEAPETNPFSSVMD